MVDPNQMVDPNPLVDPIPMVDPIPTVDPISILIWKTHMQVKENLTSPVSNDI